MHFKKGECRLVLVAGGFAVKFPIIHLRKAIGYLVRYLGCPLLLIRYCTGGMERSWTLQRHLLKGLADNWREFTFYLTQRSRFLMPTYLSVFGFLNIQRADERCEVKLIDLWCQLYELTEGKSAGDKHHFGNPDNFRILDGRLRICDYGSRKTQAVLLDYADSIYQQFDLDYSWEERKKQLARGEC